MTTQSAYDFYQDSPSSYDDSENIFGDISPTKRNNLQLEKLRASIKSSLFLKDANVPSNVDSPASRDRRKVLYNAKCDSDDLSVVNPQNSPKTEKSFFSLSNNTAAYLSFFAHENKFYEKISSPIVENAALNMDSILDKGSEEEEKSVSNEQVSQSTGLTDRKLDFIQPWEEDDNLGGNGEISPNRRVFFQDTIAAEIEEIKEELKIGENSRIYFIQGDFWNYYREEVLLGEGSSGIVKRCSKIDTNEVFAVKIIQYRGDKELLISIIHEFENLKKLDHKNIIKVYELYIDYFKKKVYTVMELADCKEMFEVLEDLGNYSEAVASGIMRQIFTGLNYLHSNGVCHRDIKPNNILVSKDGKVVKITDFNVSKFLNKQSSNKYSSLSTENYKMWTYTGTIAFNAPEIFLDTEYTESVDVWSAGAVMYTILCGYQPFQSAYIQDLIELIKEGKYTFESEQWDNISEQAKDLIRHCLDIDCKTRYSPSDALMHPWIAHQGKVSSTKILFKENLRVYYKKSNKEEDEFIEEMKKMQVISPNLAVASPTSKEKRRFSLRSILFEADDGKINISCSQNRKMKNLELKRVGSNLPKIQECWNEDSPAQRKIDSPEEKARAYQDFQEAKMRHECSKISRKMFQMDIV